MRGASFGFLACLMLAGAAVPLVGRSQDTSKASSTADSVTPEQEEAALEFARANHPELEKLLVRLRKQDQREFRKAVRQLHQTVERLARSKEREPERYETALELWKVESRVRLLAARMTMSADPELESQLRALLAQRLGLRRQQMELERERIIARLQKIDETLAEYDRDGDAVIDRELQRLTRSLPKGRGKPAKGGDSKTQTPKS